jgi:TetR/AcrR family transcriptional regulator, fatty acid metabolism regulator protein
VAYRTTEKMTARKDARRKSVLDAATHLFGGHGYHATTVPMIVAKAEISTGSFYMYFRNKEDVFAAALEALGERTLKVVHDAHTASADPLAQIGAAVESLFLFLAENPREARIMIVESSGLSPRLDQVRRGILARHTDQVRKILKSRGKGAARMNAAIAARCLVGAVFESLYAWLEKPDSKRPPAASVARAVAAYNKRALSLS